MESEFKRALPAKAARRKVLGACQVPGREIGFWGDLHWVRPPAPPTLELRSWMDTFYPARPGEGGPSLLAAP